MFRTVTLLVGKDVHVMFEFSGKTYEDYITQLKQKLTLVVIWLPLLTVTVTVSSTWVFRMYDMRMVPSTIGGYTTKQSEWQLASDIQMARTCYQTKKPPLLFVCCTLSQLPSPCSTSSRTCPPYTPLLSATDHTTGHNFIHCVQLLARGISEGTMNKLPLHTPHKGVL